MPDSPSPSAATCYVCQLPIERGQPVMQLREEDGTTWLVHKACLNEQNFEVVDDDHR